MKALTRWIRSLSALTLALLMFMGGQNIALAATKAECGAQFSSDMKDNEQWVREGKIDKEGFEQLSNAARAGYRKCLATGKYYGKW
jgi:hypothetical protein